MYYSTNPILPSLYTLTFNLDPFLFRLKHWVLYDRASLGDVCAIRTAYFYENRKAAQDVISMVSHSLREGSGQLAAAAGASRQVPTDAERSGHSEVM